MEHIVCGVLCWFNHFICAIAIGKEAKINFCSTPMESLWENYQNEIHLLYESNSSCASSAVRTEQMFDTHSTLSKNCNSYTENISITNFAIANEIMLKVSGEQR